jgi:hypothetical protein
VCTCTIPKEWYNCGYDEKKRKREKDIMIIAKTNTTAANCFYASKSKGDREGKSVFNVFSVFLLCRSAFLFFFPRAIAIRT